MAAFSYESAVEALDYDFTGCPKGDGSEGKCTAIGTVPEPSEDRLAAFSAALEANDERLSEFRAAVLAQDVDRAKAAADVLKASKQEVTEAVKKATADLCNGSPTREELDQLPPRVFGAFHRWLIEELYSPKGGKIGSSL